jgi:very-short-patch-repair endonuclease
MDALDRQLTQLAERAEVGLVVDVDLIRHAGAGSDWMIAAIAERQYGVVSRAQLLAAGIGPGAIATRLGHQRLHRLHRGVYAVGHTALAPRAREMAAVLACWPGALVTHRTAAGSIWQLVEPLADPIELTVSAGHRNRRPELRVHCSRRLVAEDLAVVHGIPATSAARTVVDLAEDVPDRYLERAFDEAVTRKLATTASIAAAVQRLPGRRGAGRLKALLERDREPAFTRSEAEERLLALIREAGLPPPEVNGRFGRHMVDFAWRDRRLIVETDGYRFHSTPTAFERDRIRDAELTGAGFRVIRVTWRQLDTEPLAVVARLAGALVPRV